MDIIKDNAKICPKCGEKMIFDEGVVYTSFPPNYTKMGASNGKERKNWIY